MSTIERRAELARMRATVNHASRGNPSLQVWLDALSQHPVLARAVEGIWSGRDGEVRAYMPSVDRFLVVGWHAGNVEYAYVS